MTPTTAHGTGGLNRLHGDIFIMILELVSSVDIYSLWMSGDSMIQGCLRQFVRRFTIGTYNLPHLRPLPLVVLQFVNIKELNIEHTLGCTLVELEQFSFEKIASISGTLESISITSDNLDIFEGFWSRSSFDSPPAKKVFPNLKHIKMSGNIERDRDGQYYHPNFMLPSLETLDMGFNVEVMPVVYDNLLSLKMIPHGYRFCVMEDLPKSLTSLDLTMEFLAPTERFFDDNGKFYCELPNLRHLSYCGSGEENIDFNSSFPSLDSLKLLLSCKNDDEELKKKISQIPPSLTSLICGSNMMPLETLSVLSNSFPILTSLKFECPLQKYNGDGDGDDDDDDDDDDDHLPWIELLPRTLTSLELSVSYGHEWSLDELSAFPKTLTHAPFLERSLLPEEEGGAGKDDPPLFGDLFPKLRQLSLIDSSHSSYSSLPPSLTLLDCNSLLTTYPIMTAIKNLSKLEHIDVRFDQEDFDEPQSLDLPKLFPPGISYLNMDTTWTNCFNCVRFQDEELINKEETSKIEKDYFFRLRTLRLATTSMINYYPSSLTSLYLRGSLINLSSFLQIAPPALVTLDCAVEDITDDDIASLPRQAQELGLRMTSNKIASYSLHGLKHLPSTLTSLEIHRNYREAPSGFSVEEAMKLIPPRLVQFALSGNPLRDTSSEPNQAGELEEIEK